VGRSKNALAIGLNAALVTMPPCPLNASPICLPVSASHSRAVFGGRSDDPLAIRTELRTRYAILMPFEQSPERRACLGVPYPRRLITRCSKDTFAVGAERRSPRWMRITLANWPAGRNLPKLHAVCR
jgi:hypothetical protein